MDLLTTFNSIPKEELEPITSTTEPCWYQKVHAFDMKHGLQSIKYPIQFRTNNGNTEHFEWINGVLVNSAYVTEDQRIKEQIRKATVKSSTKRSHSRS